MVELLSESLSESFFFFFLSFFFSFLASLSLMAVRLLSNASDCKRAASISVFNSSKPGLSSRALSCGSNENVVSVPVPPATCSAEIEENLVMVIDSHKWTHSPNNGANDCPSGVDSISDGRSKIYLGMLVPHKN